MSPLFHSDVFEIVNGPEDGTAFPVVRVPASLGRDARCAVQPRFDQAIELVHARITVVSGGYRIRAAGPSSIYVNNKKAGWIQSRIVRDGGILRTGQTEFMLRTSPEGLAARSMGLPTDSDLGWMIRRLGRGLYMLLRLGFRMLAGFGSWLKVLFTLALLLGAACFFFPSLYQWVAYYIALFRYQLYLWFQQMMGG